VEQEGHVAALLGHPALGEAPGGAPGEEPGGEPGGEPVQG